MKPSNDPSRRLRPALAALVAAVCLLSGLALVAALGGGGAAPARADRLARTPSDVEPGHPHSADLGVPGMSERDLRGFETRTLGPAHAREHALMRRAIRVARTDETPDAVDPRPAASVAAADAAAAGDPEDVGQWEPAKTPFHVVAIHAALLPTGKVMFFSYPTYPERQNYSEAWLWNPADGSLVQKDPPPVNGHPANIWCAGQTFTADGELVVFGGNLEFPTNDQNGNPLTTWKGLDEIYTFNPFTEAWKTQPKMRHGRWYPTGVRMADGRIPIVSGLDESGAINPSSTDTDVELFTPPATIGGTGTVDLIGSIGDNPNKPVGELYPRMVELASGRTYLAGPDPETTWYFDDVDADPFTWGDIPSLSRRRTWGTTVPLPAGPSGPTKMMALGGTDYSGNPSTNTTEVFNENAPGQGWQAASSNLIGRGHANTVLLPDGSMLEVGGGRGSAPLDLNPPFPSPLHYADESQKQIELWDPVTKQWRLGPPQSENRAYHSTAVLLPDGRVMSAGDEYHNDPAWAGTANVDDAEIYKPPYLFRGARPTIDSAPPTIGYGGSFGVDTPNTNIAGAALASPAAVTHGVDMNQRMLQLDEDQGTGCVGGTAPTGPTAAPPGYYMLFLLNDQGVPSVAKFVKLKGGGTLGGCGSPPPTDQSPPTVSFTAPASGATVGGKQVSVRASASDDIGVVGVQFKVDGQVGSPNIGAEDTASPYEVTWDSTKVADGQHTLTAVARDATGKTGTTTRTVTVSNPDTEAPTVSLTAPAAGTTVKGSTTWSANVFDAGVGVKQVQLMVDDVASGPPVVVATPVKLGPFSATWETTNASNAVHTLTAVARDAAGNETVSDPVTVTVDNPVGVPPDSKPPQTPTKPGDPGNGGNPPGGGGGSGGGGGGGGGSTDLAPALSKLKLSHTSFRKGKSTTISFRLSEAAKVTLSFERKLDGRRVHGRCVKPAKGKRANCTRYSRLRTVMSFQGKAGTNRLVFRGRLSRRTVLAVGRYRLTMRATDASGKRSAAAQVGFKLMESAATAQARAVRAIVLGWL